MNAPPVPPKPAMEPNASPPSGQGDPLVSQDELHRLVDGRLTPAEAAAVEARLLRDPVASALRADWQAQRERLRGLHAALLHEPLPPTLADAVRRTAHARQQTDAWWRWGGMAAGVLLAFGVGWWARGIAPAAGVPGMSPQLAARDAARVTPAAFARQAVVAHAVYAPEVRHPVEVAAAQQEHLVQWLSKRLGRPLKLPQLSAEGYELVGGRLLPGDVSGGAGAAATPGGSAARAQFMYQDSAGVRITVYLGALGQAAGTAAPAVRETAFSFSSDGPVSSFYWVDQGFGYALAGPLPREALLRIAQRVYQQLEPAAPDVQKAASAPVIGR